MQFLPRKSDALRRQGGSLSLATWVVEQGVLSDAPTAVARLTPRVGGRLVCLWLLGALDLDVPCTPRNTGKIDPSYGGLAPG